MLRAVPSDITPQRDVVHGDAVAWLAARPALAGSSVIATMPDVSELGVSLERWREFFLEAARAVLLAVPDHGLGVFIQTDTKHDGRWISKAGLILRVADALDIPLLFHKLVCRRPPGSVLHGRPGYSHILAFSRQLRDDLDHPTPDVLPDLGVMPWSHSIGTRAAEAAVSAVRRLSPATTRIVVPFCGIGTILAVANSHGLDALGIERNRKRAAAARLFTLDPDPPQPDPPR